MNRRVFVGSAALGAAGLALPGAVRAAGLYDLVLKDVKALVDGDFKRCDIGISGSSIAEIAEPGTLSGNDIISGERLYASPGWVDLHVHYVDIPHGKTAGSSIKRLGAQLGVTALLDAGTTGAYNYNRLENTVADGADVPCFALLNIKREGIKVSSFYTTRTGWDDIPAMGPVVEKHRDRIVGLKVRADKQVSARSDRLYYVRKLREAGDALGLPVTVHIGTPPPTVEDILPYLKQGDTLCHFLRGKGNCIIDESGRVSGAVREAVARGVRFDLAHGMGSYSFEAAERALEQGFTDFTVSSDLYIMSGMLYAKTFANVLTNLLVLGMPLSDIMERAGARPAKQLGLTREIREGAEATLTVFSVAEGGFTCVDTSRKKRKSEKRIIPEWTVMKGRPARSGALDRRLFL
jgi:dihydroorotase